MNQLGNNSFGLLFNKRVISNLVISLDRKFFPRIDWMIEDQEVQILDEAGVSSTVKPHKLENLLDGGYEDPLEILANAMMPIPRVLYATANPNYAPAPGIDDLDSLLNRLDAFITSPGVIPIATIPENTPPVGNPCPIQVDVDSFPAANRYTFVRTAYDVATPPQIEVDASGMDITITGQVYQSHQFSRRQAQRNPSANFQMTLRYGVNWTDDSDINLGATPFVMVTDPPAANAGAPLPAAGRVIYARSRSGGYYIPSDEKEIAGATFNGVVDDLIYESKDAEEPRYRVEPLDPATPLKVVLRDLCDDSQTVLAEAVAGRVFLQFQGITQLQFTGGVAAPPANAISQSVVKINPALAQVFTCAAGSANAAVSFNQLSLLGPTSLDFPLLPRHLLVSVDPELVTDEHVDDGDPGPVGSVRSLQISTAFVGANYFTERQAFGLFDGDPGSSEDFSEDADLCVAMGDDFMLPVLESKAETALEELATATNDDGKPIIPGLDTASLSAETRIGPEHFFISMKGEGQVKTPFFLPSIGYEFTASLKVGFEAVPTVFMRSVKNDQDEFEQKPVDRFNCAIPDEILKLWNLDPLNDRIWVQDAIARQNPLSFKLYYDPDDGRTCLDCPPLVRRPPPAYRINPENGQIYEALIPDARTMQAADEEGADVEDLWWGDLWCDTDKDDKPIKPRDRSTFFGQATFDQSDVKPQYAIRAKKFDKKDMDLDVDVNNWALFGAWLITAILVAIGGSIFGAGLGIGALTNIVGNILLATAVLIPAADAIAGAAASSSVEERLKRENFGTFSQDMNFSSFLGLYLEEPGAAPEPVEVQEGAYINRYHVVIQAANANEGFSR